MSDKTSVINRLGAYKERFDELLNLLDGTLPLGGEKKTTAQDCLKSLKADLGTEYRQMSTVRGEEALSDVERAYYAPAIHQAFADIRVAVNSIPDGEWHSNLHEARVSIAHMLHQLCDEPIENKYDQNDRF